jgi:rhodanese-related sulfurtransferase
VSYPRVSPHEAQRLIVEEGYVHLDVRTEGEFAQGHPAGAYNIPIMVPAEHGMAENPDFVRVARAAFPSAEKIIVGCRSGNRSQTAAQRLLSAGFSAVVDQRAGFGGARDPFGRKNEEGWKDAGLPCSDEPHAGRDYESLKARATQ